jgi:hypothetical protein
MKKGEVGRNGKIEPILFQFVESVCDTQVVSSINMKHDGEGRGGKRTEAKEKLHVVHLMESRKFFLLPFRFPFH